MSVTLRGRLHHEIRGIQRAACSHLSFVTPHVWVFLCPSPGATGLPRLQGGHFQFLLCPTSETCCLLSPLFCISSVGRTHKTNKSHQHLKASFLVQFGFLWATGSSPEQLRRKPQLRAESQAGGFYPNQWPSFSVPSKPPEQIRVKSSQDVRAGAVLIPSRDLQAGTLGDFLTPSHPLSHGPLSVLSLPLFGCHSTQNQHLPPSAALSLTGIH